MHSKHNLGDLYDHLTSTKIFTLTMNKISKCEESGYGIDLDLVTISYYGRYILENNENKMIWPDRVA